MRSPLDPRRLLRAMFDAAIAAAQPDVCVPAHLPEPPKGRLVVIGAGKASAAMARAVEKHWDGPLCGLVVTRYGYAVPCERIEIVEAAHPVPDAAGEAASRRVLAQVAGLSEDDLVLCLISGGGSALLPLPLPGLALADKQALNRQLLACGARIGEINRVRRHLSAIKGGRLALACGPARVLNLLMSDVPGDDPADIASGPTIADSGTREEALDVLRRYAIAVPAHVQAVLRDEASETPKAGDPRLPRIETRIVATPRASLEAAAAVARAAGIRTYVLGDALEGEAAELARTMGGIAIDTARRGGAFETPCVLLSGGETTVTVRGAGRGGRNVEFLLALAIALEGERGVFALAGDTDGVDGQEEIAGALLTPDSLARARDLGLDPRARLADNDAHTFFGALGDSVVTGPTLTNVNDFRAILVMRD
jgi:glycerate 2-kinase